MIIKEYTKRTGIVMIGAGYQDISSFKVEDLKNILEKINPETKEVRLAFVPYQKDGKRIGSALLVKTKGNDAGYWIYVTPMKGRDNERYPVPITDIIPEDS